MLLSNRNGKGSSVALVTILLGFAAASQAASQRDQEILDCVEHNPGEDVSKLCRNQNNGATTKQKGRRQVGSEVCATSLAQDGQSSIICSTTIIPTQLSSNVEEGGEVRVSIRAPNNRTQFELGSSPTFECRAMASLKLGQDYELSMFKLRWLHNNKTIASNIASADSSTTVIGTSARLWSVARDGGLDLEISDFRSTDAGNYTCQALNTKTSAVLNEDVITLEASVEEGDIRAEQHLEEEEEAAVAASMKLYSRSNLANLLPTLRVVPAFIEISPGDTLQLACVTSGLDPEPDPSELEWSFEWLPGNRELLLDTTPEAASQMPVNLTVMGGGNLLTIWWAGTDHVGLYRCRHHLDQFNLTSEAVGEVALRPSADSAPLVFLEPELVRLPVNGSARIQCEATGYPRPTITWYRVEGGSTTSESKQTSDLNNIGATVAANNDNEVEFEEVEPKDTSIYCRLNKCSAPNSSKVTGVSIVHLRQARAQQQGQWVCRADNKHGSNQVSALVDVEFREAPRVRLVPNSERQTILLSLQGEQNDPNAEVATFRCLVEAGRPRPKLRWLRLAAGGGGSGTGSEPAWAPDNLDLYDLTKMSSATSNVSTRLVSSGTNQQELVLEVRTVSPEDEGAYVCVAENEWGRHSALAHLQVRRPAQVRILQKSPWLAKPNDTFQLDCLVSGHPKPIDIEWSRPDRGAFFALISRGSMAQQAETSNIHVAERAVLKFDRVGLDDSGEYECLARDPSNSSLVLRDTIMVVVEGESTSASSIQEQEQRLPRLVVSPTKATIKLGANLTLDCLAIGGLQPTLVEWQAPHVATWHHHHQYSNMTLIKSSSASASGLDIWPYYRSRQHQSTSLVQLGSKLRILNASKQHEGVYQCKGRNRAGIEVAPALVKLAEVGSEKPQQEQENQNSATPVKTKVASLSSNIELKCQVSGVEEQPATSWSRDGQELPQSSLQIGHNLWIQNVSHQDGGLYVCSARSDQPDKLIQAKINLQVRATASLAQGRMLKSLKGRIVASKSQVNVGDSITLECIVSSSATNVQDKSSQSMNEPSAMELEELERQVVWTNLHSGQSVFQDNVYVSNNLLVIYNLRAENSATYRCNYNELTQSTDYKLQVESSSSSSSVLPANSTEKDANSTEQQQPMTTLELRQVAQGAQVELECVAPTNSSTYYWTRNSETRLRLGETGKPLTFDSIKSHEADLYQCHMSIDGTSKSKTVKSILVQVLVSAARFLQKPVSFITLPAMSGADQQLELELVIYPERDKGLILFGGSSNQSGDYISLGLNKGYLEFKFELGDGLTRLRSLQPLQMNQWHRALIERNRRGAVMWVDKEPAVSNSSSGKFFNLNLDSVLYVGGHQHFLNSSKRSFHGYQRGFLGCISSLRIGRRQMELMARNRSVSMGIYECDKSRCSVAAHQCSPPNGVCQVDSSSTGLLRCICLPGFGGAQCQRSLADDPINDSTMVKQQIGGGACELLPQPPCSPNGTLSCQSLSKSSFKCHCKLGHMGDTCQDVAQFPMGNDSSVWFNQLAYLHLRLNKPGEESASNDNGTELANRLTKLGSMAESQSISFRLRTNSSYGLIFYLGQTWPELANDNLNHQATQNQAANVQTSKSMVANLLARLFTTVTDYLAIALVDGHVELSYELGSGVAILRSSRRVNDSQPHRIQVLRQGKLAKLIIDELHKHEGSSPGKLSMLNVPGDVYLGGLPHLAELTHNMYMSGFVGCVSQLQLNSLGPLNLVQSDQLAQVRSARNLAPCQLISSSTLEPPLATTSSSTTTAKPQPHKPWKAAAEPSDDPDEM